MAIVDETSENTPREAQIELRADLLERLFVGEGRSARYMIRRFGKRVVQELLDLGLEVDGQAPPGCLSTWDIVPTLPPQQAHPSLEAALLDFLKANPSAASYGSRLQMYP